MNTQETSERYSDYESIPLFLDASAIMNLLGLSRTTVYYMLQEKDFPTIEIGKRRMVRKEKLFEWIDAHENPNSCITSEGELPHGSRFTLRTGGNL